MDFELSETQSIISDMAVAFGDERIAPYARDWEREGTIPRDLWRSAGQNGFGGIAVEEDSGGSGLSRVDGTLIFEALARACPSVAAFLSIHNMCVTMIDRFGSSELKQRYLPGALRMDAVFSFCLTEPGSGSDAAALRTRADRTNEGWLLSGTKSFISGGGYSDAYIVFCRTGDSDSRGISAIVVDAGAPGLSFGALEDKMGWRSQPTRQVNLEACEVGSSNLLGEEGRGFRYAMKGLDDGRLNISACSLGGAQAALDKTVSYMGERKAFGSTLAAFQGLRFRVAEMETQLQAARNLVHKAAWMLDNGSPDGTRFAAMAKLFTTDACFKVANECLQLHGGYGYLADYGIEKIVRDLRVHQILEGTNEIMRLIVARDLLPDEPG